jgi:hypothetical protein
MKDLLKEESKYPDVQDVSCLFLKVKAPPIYVRITLHFLKFKYILQLTYFIVYPEVTNFVSQIFSSVRIIQIWPSWAVIG